MTVTAFGDFLSGIFGIDSLAEDLIKYLVYTALGAVFWRLIKMMNGWKGWKTSKRKEFAFWAVSLPAMFALVTFASGLGGARGGKFKAGVIAISQFLNPIPFLDTTNQVKATMPGISPSAWSRMDAKGANFLAVLKVDNAGPPSTAWNWKGTVEIPGGTKLDAIIPAVSIGTNIQPLNTIIGPYTPKNENNLIELIGLHQLAQGDSKMGWLMFHVSGITEMPPKSIIRISFDNVFGRQTVIEHQWMPPSR